MPHAICITRLSLTLLKYITLLFYYGLTYPTSSSVFLICFFLVSQDAAISIAIGILSLIVSLVSLFIGYLTLRAMASGTVPALHPFLLTATSSEKYRLTLIF
jgi:hypothetical protein